MEILTDDIICDLATFCTPKDLVNLGRTCQRFGRRPGGCVAKKRKKRKCIYSTKKRQKANNDGLLARSSAERSKEEEERTHQATTDAEGREWSLIDEAARKIVELEGDIDEEWRSSALSNRKSGKESWIGVYDRLVNQWKCTPLKFSHFIGNGFMSHVEGDISRVRSNQDRFAFESIALCQEVMKTGTHYAEFTITKRNMERQEMWVALGLLRPIHEGANIRTKTTVGSVHSDEIGNYVPLPWGYESYCCNNSERPGFEGNEHSFFIPIYLGYPPILGEAGIIGMFPEYEPEGRIVIGLLLDLDEGTLTGYYKGRNRGVLKKGLRGHYRWTASPHDCCSVKIQKGPSPADS